MPDTIPAPVYRDAAYGGESILLGNAHIRLVIHKRERGWGWGELYAPDRDGHGQRLMAVVEHLGEVDIVGFYYPLRLEAESYDFTESEGVQRLTFQLLQQLPQEPWMRFDNFRSVSGRIELALAEDDAWISYRLFAQPNHSLEIRSLRGAWLRFGAGSFGAAKTDGILPGMEWVQGKEWSSGTHNQPHRFANHVAPDPRKVSFPLMALSFEGTAVGLSWKEQYLDRVEETQPVFAAPNFIDRCDDSLLGLMLPSVTWGLPENSLAANPPISFPRDGFHLWGEIGTCPGDSLDMVVAWVKRHGLPDPGPARLPYAEAVERIARAFNSNLWLAPGEERPERAHFATWPQGESGFLRSWHLAPVQPFMDVSWTEHVDLCKRIPRVVDHYLTHHDNALSRELREKRDWCLDQAPRTERTQGRFGKKFDLFGFFDDAQLRAFADGIAAHQTDAGDFPFDPLGRHRSPHLQQANAYRPFGQPGDTCLNFCATSSLLLLLAGDCLGEERYLAAARKGLDFVLPLNRPEGGDWWETPLHAPNFMSAGYAALAYYLGWQLLGDECYKARAVRFIRSLLPFVNLWAPPSSPRAYQPTPLFGSTAWHAMDWSTRTILWHVLMLFELFGTFGIEWAQVDPEIDWDTFHKGVTHAGLRWMADHTDPTWIERVRKEKIDSSEAVLRLALSGALDTLVPDNHDPVRDAYGGMQIFIAPDTLASNILQRLAREDI